VWETSRYADQRVAKAWAASSSPRCRKRRAKTRTHRSPCCSQEPGGGGQCKTGFWGGSLRKARRGLPHSRGWGAPGRSHHAAPRRHTSTLQCGVRVSPPPASRGLAGRWWTTCARGAAPAALVRVWPRCHPRGPGGTTQAARKARTPWRRDSGARFAGVPGWTGGVGERRWSSGLPGFAAAQMPRRPGWEKRRAWRER
jgi:hypothetical protein